MKKAPIFFSIEAKNSELHLNKQRESERHNTKKTSSSFACIFNHACDIHFFTIFIIECVSFFIISLQMHETFEIQLRKCQEKNWFEKTACDKRLIYADTRRHAQYFPFSRAHTRTFIASIVVISSPPHFECTTRTKKAHCFHCQPHTSVPISWFVCCFFSTEFSL